MSIHFKSPLYSIDPPSSSSSPSPSTTSPPCPATVVTIPRSGLYGFILGKETQTTTSTKDDDDRIIKSGNSNTNNNNNNNHHHPFYDSSSCFESKIVIATNPTAPATEINTNVNVTTNDNAHADAHADATSTASRSYQDTEDVKARSSNGNMNMKAKYKFRRKNSRNRNNSNVKDELLPFHCGCTFRATFSFVLNSSEEGEEEEEEQQQQQQQQQKQEKYPCHTTEAVVQSIMLPFTSQPIDPLSVSLQGMNNGSTKVGSNFNTDVNGNGNENADRNIIDSDTGIIRVATTTKIARLIYIKGKTNVALEYVTSCQQQNQNHDATAPTNVHTNNPCDQSSWKWAIFSHQFKDKHRDLDRENNKHHEHKKRQSSGVDADVDMIVAGSSNNHHCTQNENAVVHGNKHEHDEHEHDEHEHDEREHDEREHEHIHERGPVEKRPRCDRSPPTSPCPDLARDNNKAKCDNNSGKSVNKSNSNKSNHPAEIQIVDFFPEEAHKKPLLCTVCFKKFPTAMAIYKHSIHAHYVQCQGQGQAQGRLLQYSDNNVSISNSNGNGNSNKNNSRCVQVVGPGPSILYKPLRAPYDDNYLVVVVKPQGLSVQGERWTLAKSDLLLPFRLKVDGKMLKKVKKRKNKKMEEEGWANGEKKEEKGDMNEEYENTRKAEGHGKDDFDNNEKIDFYNDALSKPRPVHRLDSATGGLLLVAKTHSSEVALKKCFSDKTIRKRYRAIVFGRLEGNENQHQNQHQPLSSSPTLASNRHPKGTINSPISGKESLTNYTVVSYSRCPNAAVGGWITTVDLEPVTGRQHQLRKHLKLVGHPIWGDKRYGPYKKVEESFDDNDDTEKNDHHHNDTPSDSGLIEDRDVGVDIEDVNVSEHPHSKLCLWALEITFPHPRYGDDVNVKIDEPDWYSELRDDQEKKWQDKFH